jgi:hypothetical protein
MIHHVRTGLGSCHLESFMVAQAQREAAWLL